MAKIEITKTELVWPGKYNDDGTRKEVPRVNLPFQVIETTNESRATRETKKDSLPGIFETYHGEEGDTFEAGWKNKLIWGDNLLVIRAIRGQTLRTLNAERQTSNADSPSPGLSLEGRGVRRG